MTRHEPSYEALELRDETERVPCPFDKCRAKAGQRCTNWITGKPLLVSHWQRIRAAQGKDRP